MRRFRVRPALVLASILCAAVAAVLFAARSEPAPIGKRVEAALRTETVLSETYTVDRKYRSMMGPWSGQTIQLGDVAADELVWIVGYAATMVGADGETPMPQEFMCHSNLDLDAAEHQRILGVDPAFNPRLFTLSQGQFEIEFPPGFGIPIRSSEVLDLTTQVLNLNVEGQTFEVRHRVSIDYVLDREVGPGMTPLLPTAAYGLALLEGDDGYFGIESPVEEQHGPGCMVGESASDHAYEDGHGRSFTGHWQVPPGRQENRTLVTRLMQVPYETTLHYIAVHLHPFAESLTLHDRTTGEVLFTSRAENYTDKIGLRHVEAFSSVEGVTLHPDHDYELVSIYDNTSGAMQDSMAVMYLYLRDQTLEARFAEGA